MSRPNSLKTISPSPHNIQAISTGMLACWQEHSGSTEECLHAAGHPASAAFSSSGSSTAQPPCGPVRGDLPPTALCVCVCVWGGGAVSEKGGFKWIYI